MRTSLATGMLQAEQVIEKVLDENINQSAISKFFETLPEKALSLGVRVILALVAFIFGKFIIKFIRSILKKSLERAKAETSLINFLDSFIKIAMYAVLFLFIGTYFGMDATSVIALVGSAGVAIGLAIQGSLSNFVGGVLILLLKPFRVGDYIIEDGHKNEGTVAEIQLFYTKLKTLDNKVVVLPNGNLANTSLTNVTGSKQRMLIIQVGISYQSDIKKAKEILHQLVVGQELVIHEKKITIYVDDLAESSVVLGLRCFVPTQHYWDIRWDLLEKIKLTFDEQGIEIPFNQLDVHVEQKA